VFLGETWDSSPQIKNRSKLSGLFTQGFISMQKIEAEAAKLAKEEEPKLPESKVIQTTRRWRHHQLRAAAPGPRRTLQEPAATATPKEVGEQLLPPPLLKRRPLRRCGGGGGRRRRKALLLKAAAAPA
jgi:hypothetical protein